MLGLALGVVGTVLGSFGPPLLTAYAGGGWWLLPLLLLLVVLVAGIVLTVKRSTRRTGAGMLVGFAVGLVVFAGTCLYLLSQLEFG